MNLDTAEKIFDLINVCLPLSVCLVSLATGEWNLAIWTAIATHWVFRANSSKYRSRKWQALLARHVKLQGMSTDEEFANDYFQLLIG